MENKSSNFISVIVYVYNNEKTICDFLTKINNVISENFKHYEIICVNDQSTDESVNVVKKVSQDFKSGVFSIINMSYYQGVESAMMAGIDLAIGDFVFEFDNTFIDYDLKTIMDVYNHSLSGYDIVAASNSKSKFSSHMFYSMFNKNANNQYKLGQETFRILSRRGINRIHSMSKTIPYRKAVYSNSGLKIDTIKYNPVTSMKILHSKQQKKNRQDTAINTLVLFTDVAYKLSITFSIMMMLATVAVGVYVLIIFILKQPVAGYTTTMLVLTGSFFGVFAILAIIIKYLSIIVDLIFRKQTYMVESIEKL